MDLYEGLLERRTVYKYKPQPVPDEVIARALEAARWAPNHRLTEPWRFVVVGPETRQALGPVAERLARAKARDATPEDLPAILDRAVKKVTGLPGLIVVTSQRSPDDAFLEKEDYAASVCALHNLVLSLWNDGVGAQWGTGGVTRDEETYRLLGIDRAEAEIIGFVKLGYPEEVPSTKRRPLDEVMRRLP